MRDHSSGGVFREGGWELIWNSRRAITESPVWDPESRRVFCIACDVEGRNSCVLAYEVDSGRRQTWNLPEQAGSIGICESGRLIVALRRRIVLVDLVTGRLDPLTGEIDEPDGNWLNDGRPGPDGHFWVGTVDARRPWLFDGRVVPDPTGSIYRVRGDGEFDLVVSGYIASNGIAFSPGGATLYHADTAAAYYECWQFDAGGEKIWGRHRVVSLAADTGYPDGAAIDSDGHYWSAGITAGRINRFAQDGALVTHIHTPCASPTMPCFADGWLYMTSLAGVHRLGASHLSSRPHNIAGLFRMPTAIVGAPVARFSD
jgi:sugar lactone lactonase YvrE